MAFQRYAALRVLSARIATRGAPLVKNAHRVDFDYTPREGYLYVRSRAISSRCNDNFDLFPAEEIEKSWRTFIGKPVFVNHSNENHRRARGVIVDAALHRDTNPDGSPDTWVEVLHEIDAKAFPKLTQAILTGKIDRTSMGCDVEYSICSACGNRATTPLEYCAHIPRMKGKKFRNASTGEDTLIYEACYGLQFFENSHLVEEPADPTAYTWGVDTRGLGKAAAKTAALGADDAFMVKDWTVIGGPYRAEDLSDDEWDALEEEARSKGAHLESAEIVGSSVGMGWNIPKQSASGDPSPDAPPKAAVTRSPEYQRGFAAGQRDIEAGDPPIVMDGSDYAHGYFEGYTGETPEQAQAATDAFNMYTRSGPGGPTVGDIVDWKRKHGASGDPSPGAPPPPDPGAGDSAPQQDSSGGGNSVPGLPGGLPGGGGGGGAGGGAAAAESELPELAVAAAGMPWMYRHKDNGEASTPLCKYCYKPCDDPSRCPGSPNGDHRPENDRLGAAGSGFSTGFVQGRLDASLGKPPDVGGREGQEAFGYLQGYSSNDPLASTPIDPERAARFLMGRKAGKDQGDIADLHAGPAAYSDLANHLFAGHHVHDENLFDPEGWHDRAHQGTDWGHVHPIVGLPGGLPLAATKLGYGEVLAPQEVDTLREENCPVCGSDIWNGDECAECGFISPPDFLMDPDTEVAKNTDLRGNESPSSMDDEGAPTSPQSPVLNCPNCDSRFQPQSEPAQAPGTPVDAGDAAAEGNTEPRPQGGIAGPNPSGQFSLTKPKDQDQKLPPGQSPAPGGTPPKRQSPDDPMTAHTPDLNKPFQKDKDADPTKPEDQPQQPKPPGAPAAADNVQPGQKDQSADKAQTGQLPKDQQGDKLPQPPQGPQAPGSPPKTDQPPSGPEDSQKPSDGDQKPPQDKGDQQGQAEDKPKEPQQPKHFDGSDLPTSHVTDPSKPKPGEDDKAQTQAKPGLDEGKPQDQADLDQDHAQRQEPPPPGETQKEPSDSADPATTDTPQPTDRQEGDVCPVCGEGVLQQEGSAPDQPAPPQQDDSSDQDQAQSDGSEGQDQEDKPPWLKDKKKDDDSDSSSDKKTSRLSVRAARRLRVGTAQKEQSMRRMQKEQSMRPTLQALAEQQVLLDRHEAMLAEIARAAGLEGRLNQVGQAYGQKLANLRRHAEDSSVPPEFEEHKFTSDDDKSSDSDSDSQKESRRRAKVRRQADSRDPAQPVDEPAGGEGLGSNEDWRGADAWDNPTNIGSSPVTDVSADDTTTVDQIGGENASDLQRYRSKADQQDVTVPVQGSDDRRPLNEVRTEVDVQTKTDPLNPNTMFPLRGPWSQRPTLSSAQRAEHAQARTFASMRLARLRRDAGIESGDDLDIGQRIASDQKISDEVIVSEINTLQKVLSARPPQREGRRAPVDARQVPSLTSTASRQVEAGRVDLVGKVSPEEFLFD